VGLGQTEGAAAAHRPAEDARLARAGAQAEAGQQRHQPLQEHPERVVGRAGPPAAAPPVGRGQRERPDPVGPYRLGQVVVQPQPLERGPLVPGGGVQQQAHRQPVTGAGPGRPGDAVADRPPPAPGGEAGEAQRAGGDARGLEVVHVAGAQQPPDPVAAREHPRLDQAGAAGQGRGRAERAGGHGLPAGEGRGSGGLKPSPPEGRGHRPSLPQTGATRRPASRSPAPGRRARRPRRRSPPPA
jgi:hypothetical protein